MSQEYAKISSDSHKYTFPWNAANKFRLLITNTVYCRRLDVFLCSIVYFN